ncbi:hypothetical protein BS47DRAFT_1390318 [Hydnum rufescens UP504]|uniref:Uncharacterized protein n=1 Tax=Hydnum rufescens UP504 TaxID=1448309 RepID=A0A9P6B3H5_9AGAM|nr:hypothetical protein BS47DRAFT_1390318 [Hydnum rufescens UP504]
MGLTTANVLEGQTHNEPPIVKEESPHLMRITTHGKLRAFVTFALKFLEARNNPTRPLVLHTLHPSKPQVSAVETLPVVSEAAETAEPDVNATPIAEETQTEPPKKRQKMDTATNTVPRLISVVEIIKREFLASARRRVMSAIPLVPWRANHPRGPDRGNEEDQVDLILALSGKNYLNLRRTPYLKVFLCRRELPPGFVVNATYQPPLEPPPKSRSAKARERKRRKKLATAPPLASSGPIEDGNEGSLNVNNAVGRDANDMSIG